MIDEQIRRLHKDRRKNTHCISIGEIANCQLLFFARCLTLPQLTLALFYRLGKFWSIWKKKSLLYFMLLFVGKHLKEIEGLNDKSVCIHSGAAVLKDCIAEQPICWGHTALGHAMASKFHRAWPGRGCNMAVPFFKIHAYL